MVIGIKKLNHEFIILGFMFGILVFQLFNSLNLDFIRMAGYFAKEFNPSSTEFLKECYNSDINELVCFNLTTQDISLLTHYYNVTIENYKEYYKIKFNLPKVRYLE